MLLRPKMMIVCSTCGSPNVDLEAFCSWNEDAQRIEADLCDRGHSCRGCGLHDVGVHYVPMPMSVTSAFSPIDWILEETDWNVLHKQQSYLIDVLERCGKLMDKNERNAIDGIVTWIDSIQDYAAGIGLWTFLE